MMLVTLLATVLFGNSDLRVGETAPFLEAHEVAGSHAAFDLAKYRGKVVVLEFWATWCAPCIDQFGHINQLAQGLSKSPVEFVSVSIDEGADADGKVTRLLKERPLQTTVVVADGSTKKRYGIDGVPTTIVIDKTGKVEAVTVPGNLTAEALERVASGQPSGLKGRFQTGATAPPTQPADAPLLSVSVKKSTSQIMGGFNGRGGFVCQGAPISLLASHLYSISPKKVVVEGDLPNTKWDVEVKFPAALHDAMMLSVPSMVESAVGFTAKKEERSLDAYVVTCPSGSKTGQKGELRLSTYAGGGHWSRATGAIGGVKAPFSRFMDQVEQVLDAPLIDKSGLDGEFDYRLSFTEGDNASLLQALKEAGLELKRERVTVPVLVLRPAK